MKSYQFFQICKRFDKKEKNTYAAVNEKRKTGLCLTTGCFTKSFNMIINNFFVSQAHSQHNFCLLISE